MRTVASWYACSIKHRHSPANVMCVRLGAFIRNKLVLTVLSSKAAIYRQTSRVSALNHPPPPPTRGFGVVWCGVVGSEGACVARAWMHAPSYCK